MKFVLAVFAIALLAFPSVAQPKFKLYPDSIRVEMPEQNGLVVFEFKEFTESETYLRNFSATLTEVLGYVKQSLPGDLSASKPQRIEVHAAPEGMKEVGLGVKPYGEKKQFTIRPIEPGETTMTILKDKGIVELLPPGWEVLLVAKEYRVKVYAADFASLEKIAAQDFGIVADALKKDTGMKTLGKKSIEAQMTVRKSVIDQQAIQYVYPGDNIGLTMEGGVGLVQGVFYPELSLKLFLSFRDRMRRPNFRTSLVGNYMYFVEQTSEGFQTFGNSFLSGTFEVNFDRKSGKASWSGLGIGFLVNRNGNYFKGGTGKFFITHTIPGSRFSMVPEFYLTDDFKKFTFGMTLKYSF
jgi:hypothetical protein